MLNRLRQRHEAILYPTPQQKIRRRIPSTRSRCQGQFENNRTKAETLVENTRNALLQQLSVKIKIKLLKNFKKRIEEPSNSTVFSKDIHTGKRKGRNYISNIRDIIGSCAAFMFNLETCLQDDTLTDQDINLILNAAQMALKPQTSTVENNMYVFFPLILTLIVVFMKKLRI